MSRWPMFRYCVAFLRPLKTALADLQYLLQAQPITLADVPRNIEELWRTEDGRARVESSQVGNAGLRSPKRLRDASVGPSDGTSRRPAATPLAWSTYAKICAYADAPSEPGFSGGMVFMALKSSSAAAYFCLKAAPLSSGANANKTKTSISLVLRFKAVIGLRIVEFGLRIADLKTAFLSSIRNPNSTILRFCNQSSTIASASTSTSHSGSMKLTT